MSREQGIPAVETAFGVTLRVDPSSRRGFVGTPTPPLSWATRASRQGWLQYAYELRVVIDGEEQSTGQIRSREQMLVDWPFAPLASRSRGTAQVRVWGEDGDVSPWSDAVAIDTTLLHRSDWAAGLVQTPWCEDVTIDNPPTMFRTSFSLQAQPVAARVHATALGVFELRLNGERVGSEALAPGWTDTAHRLPFVTVDVTELLRQGENVLGAIVADGWYRGRLGWGAGNRNVYGDTLGLSAQLEVELADGTIERIVTDGSWTAATGAVVTSSLYDGELVDLRLDRPGWDAPGFVDAGWSPVLLGPPPTSVIEPAAAPPVVAVEEISPQASRSPSGRLLLDVGKIVTGRLRVSLVGAAGRTITIRHAEVLQDGELCTRPLRTAVSVDRLVVSDDEPITWEPTFTMHGFRYAEITGVDEAALREVVAVVYRSDIERIGWFQSSDPEVDTLHENVVNSIAGNFVSIPTDCPQRDERLGWTGDASIIAPTASFLFDVHAFYDSWLRELALAQRPSGTVPMVVPPIPLDAFPGDYPVVAWGDAATIVPDVIRERYGDVGVLRRQQASMRAWAVASASAALEHEGVSPDGFQFGDWLDPTAPPEHPEDTQTDVDLLAVLYAIRACETVLRSGADEEADVRALLADLRALLERRFVTADGLLTSDSQTAYAVALTFGVLDEHRATGARERIGHVVERDRRRLLAGFIGASTMLDALVDAGRVDLAFALLLRRTVPSWLYPVTMGATTIWERWDSLLPDGTVNPGDMTSFTHFSLGAVADWLHRRLAGLAPAAPGYRVIRVAPVIGGGFTHARAVHRTPYGLACAGWRMEDDELVVFAVIPPNAEAEIVLPGSSAALHVGSGGHEFRVPRAAAVP